MSLWELLAAVDGWKRANSPDDKPDAPSGDWLDEELAKAGL